MIKEKFIGSWQLKSIIVSHNGYRIYPFGKHVSGFLVYIDNGFMAVQIMMPRRYPVTEKEKAAFHLEELAQTLKAAGYLAYYGKFDIDTHHQRVTHHVEGSLAQPLVGGTEVRHYKFIEDSISGSVQKLVLSSGNMELTWIKI